MRRLQFISCPINAGSVSLKPAPRAQIPLVTESTTVRPLQPALALMRLMVQSQLLAAHWLLWSTGGTFRQSDESRRWGGNKERCGQRSSSSIVAMTMISWPSISPGKSGGVLMYFIHSAVASIEVSRADNQLPVVGCLDAEWAASPEPGFSPINRRVFGLLNDNVDTVCRRLFSWSLFQKFLMQMTCRRLYDSLTIFSTRSLKLLLHRRQNSVNEKFN